MNYIYDIYINFQNNYYDFYEWNKKDKIIHIKKIPIFKISTQILSNLKKNKIKIDKTFLKKIENETKTFNNKNILYSSIFSDGKDIICINFTKEGINKQKSAITIDKQEDLINIVKNKKNKTIKYKLLTNNCKNTFQTRFEKENEESLLKIITNMYKNKKIQPIKYIYLECFGKNENDINKATKKIKKEIIKTNDNFYKIANILKLLNQK